MPESKTTTTVEYEVDEFSKLVLEKLYPGKNPKLEFVIQEVGGDMMDRYPGQKQVTKVKITFDGAPE